MNKTTFFFGQFVFGQLISLIELTVNDGATKSKLKLRKIQFYDRELKREFEFLTNLVEMRPDLVAAIYKSLANRVTL